MHKYQLIYPFVSNRLYGASSIKGGAKKCYNELKQLDEINCDHFTVLDADTLETYNFMIHQQNHQQGGHIMNTGHDNIADINTLNNKLTSVILRLDDIEHKIHQLDNQNVMTGGGNHQLTIQPPVQQQMTQHMIQPVIQQPVIQQPVIQQPVQQPIQFVVQQPMQQSMVPPHVNKVNKEADLVDDDAISMMMSEQINSIPKKHLKKISHRINNKEPTAAAPNDATDDEQDKVSGCAIM